MRKFLLCVLLTMAFCQGYSQSCEAPEVSDATICAGSTATIRASGENGEYRWYDAISNGNLLSTGPQFTTPVLTATTNYYVEVVNDDCISPRSLVTITVGLTPTVSGMSICSGSSTTLTAEGPGGIYEWYDAPSNGNLLHIGSSYTTNELSATTTYYVRTILNECTSARTAVTVTVNNRQDLPLVPDVTMCAGSATTLTATGPAGSIYQWFNTAEGGIPLIISPDYTTPVLNTTTVFYVESLLNGCTSLRTAVTVTVNPIASAPTATDVSICAGSTATLTAGGGGSYVWYAVPSRGNPLWTGEIFTTPALNRTTTYYVQTSVNDCVSERTPVTVTVTQIPEAPVVADRAACIGSSKTLTASAPIGNYAWFDSAEGGNLLAGTASFTTPVLTSSITYYVEASINGCISPRTAVVVIVSQPPSAPVISDVTICSGSAVTLTPNAFSGLYEWYDAPSGGNLLLTGPQFTTPAITANTTYYVQASADGCTSERIPVKITIKPVPPTPMAAGIIICGGTAGVLSVNTTVSSLPLAVVEYQWFDAEGNLLATTPTYTTPVLNSTATYYVQAVMEGCASGRVPVTVSVFTFSGRLFRYFSGTYCKDSKDPVPTMLVPLKGTFSAQPVGIVFKNTATGEIDLNASAVGNYVITFVADGACPLTSTTPITITQKPNAEFQFAGPYCQGDTNPLATYPTGGSGGVFTVSIPGLFFTREGTIDLQRTNPGTYVLTNTIPASGGSCVVTSASDTVVVLPSVQVNAGADQVISPGTSVSLSGSVNNTSGYSWSGGKGSFSNASSLTPIYTPASDEASVTLFLTANGIAPCLTAKTDTINISVLFAPVVPDQTICSGSTATLSVTTAPSATYEWYDSPSGGNLPLVNPSFVTPVLTSGKIYYVRAVLGGLSSARVPVNVNILPVLEAPLANSAAMCSENSATLTATGSGGTFQWYDDATGGNLLASDAIYTTPSLKYTTTYYVQKISGACVSPRTAVTVTVSPKPVITGAALATICNSTTLNYQITADQPGATFMWSRAAVEGILNEPLTGQTSSVIREILTSTGIVPLEVTYVITPSLNGCTGPSFNYVVTVDPSPVATSSLKGQICNNSASNYTITYNMPGTNFSWSRAAVSGISNRAIGGQKSATIREILTNTTNAPLDVNYIFNQSYDGCASPPFTYVVTVAPSPQITSRTNSVLCSNTPLNYTITSNIKGAAFTWSRAAVAGISNPSVTDEASETINEILINTGRTAIVVTYSISATASECPAPVFNYTVTINPTTAPVITTTSPVCIDGRIALSTTQVQGASYSWKGPKGFTSNKLNPLINNVTELNEGRYSLVATVNGCASDTAYADIVVSDPPLANASTDQQVCASTTGINLRGTIGGGASAGAWTSSGSGAFLPSNTDVNATYIPSQSDKDAGLIKLSLTATSNCASAVSSIDITLVPFPVVDAGLDREVCSQSPNVTLSGKISIPQNILWTSSGTGLFQPSNTSLNAVYVPSSSDINNGSVVLILSSEGISVCLPVKDEIKIRIVPPPVVNIGRDILLPFGRTVTLNPTINEKDSKYLWTPNINLSDNTLKNPVLTGVSDQVYKITVTDSRGCVTEDEIFVDVLMPIVTRNTFTPNGDGVNDIWNIPELTTYPDNTVFVFNRYGDKIFSSVGYEQPWDGTHNGVPAPVGTYYYVINTKFPGLVYSGYVTILR